MWPAFPASDYYEGSVNVYRIGGHTPLSSVHAFPSSHAGLHTRARLPVAVFLLAFRKSPRMSRSSYARSLTPCGPAYMSSHHSPSQSIRMTGTDPRPACEAV
jgi:hypothetical protein